MDRTLKQEVNALHAQICAGLADPNRITILYALADGPQYITEGRLTLDPTATPISSPTTTRATWPAPVA